MDKIYNTLGLAYRARKIVLGTDQVIEQIRNNQIKLVLINANSSVSTLKKMQNKLISYKVDYIILNDYEQNLDKLFNKKAIKILGLSDKGFINLIKKSLKES